MIKSFDCRETEKLFNGRRSKFGSDVLDRVKRKLDLLDAAVSLDDLRSPPGNRLEALKGDRAGQHSIRVNNKWRICFVWTEDGPENVECVDYH